MSVWFFFDTFEYDILSLANSRLIEKDQIFKAIFCQYVLFRWKWRSSNLFRKKQMIRDPKKRRRKSVLDVIWILSCCFASRFNPRSFPVCMHNGNAPTLIHRNLRICLYSLYVMEAQNGNRRTNKIYRKAIIEFNCSIFYGRSNYAAIFLTARCNFFSAFHSYSAVYTIIWLN